MHATAHVSTRERDCLWAVNFSFQYLLLNYSYAALLSVWTVQSRRTSLNSRNLDRVVLRVRLFCNTKSTSFLDILIQCAFPLSHKCTHRIAELALEMQTVKFIC